MARSVTIILATTALVTLVLVLAVPAAASASVAAPTNVVAEATSSTSITLTWDKSRDHGFSYFAVRRTTDPTLDQAQWTRLPGNDLTPTVTDSGLSPQTTYYYYVTEIDTAGTVSGRSAVASATTLPGPPPPVPIASCATTGTVWCGDFDTANISQYSELLGQPSSRLTFPTSPILGGTQSARFELRPGDAWTDGTNRMQLRRAPWNEGQDLYFHWALYVDPSTTIGGSFSNPWRTLVAWPTSQDGRCSPLKFVLMRTDGRSAQPNGTDSLGVSGDLGDCGANDVGQWTLANPVKGAWYEFITHIKFSATPGNGRFEFWMMPPGSMTYTKQTFNHGTLSGEQTYTGATIGHAGDSANLRVGTYRNKSFTTTDVIYYDRIRASTSFAGAQ